MAVWVNGKLPGRAFLRLAYFTPTILPMIAVANIWLFFYTPEYGLLEQATKALGGSSHNWLGSKSTALASLMVVTVWKEAGFFMIFYLAALQQISPSLAEAAAIEGASRSYFFRRVHFPLLMPTTLFVMVNAVINAFRLVDHVVVMTRGGPDNATSLLLYYIYEIGFRFWDSTYAAALTMVLLAMLGVAACCSSASSTAGCTTNDVRQHEHAFLVSDVRGGRGLDPGPAMGAAPGLCSVDRVPSG